MPLIGSRANAGAFGLGWSAGGEQALPYQWVAVGQTGNLRTSTSTTASTPWTSRTSSFGTGDIMSVASNGVDLYVAVGLSGKLATSPDGITWTQRTSSFGTSPIYGIAWGEGYWVASGGSGKVATSTDGITWTQRTVGATDGMYCSAYGNGLYIVGGFQNATANIFTATDPTSTWTARTSTISSGGSIWLNDAIYYAPAQNIWVIGFDGTLITPTSTGTLGSSTDGINWTSRNSPFAMGYLSQGGFTSTNSVIVGGVVYDSGNEYTDVMSSTNGTSWTNRTPAFSNYPTKFAVVDDAGFMLIGGARIQSTTDGVTWTDRGEIAGGTVMNGCCHSAGKPSIR